MIVVFLIASCYPIRAQQDAHLPGEVVEQNSKFNTGRVNYLSNVEIKSPGAAPQLSDMRGKFTLVFADKPFGDVARVYVSKNNYEVVNDEELKKAAVMGRRSPLKVVLCQAGQLYENQMAYYRIARDAALEAYRKRADVLEKEGREKDLLLAEMRLEFNQEINTVADAYECLQKQLQDVEKQAKELADKFVAINLDDQSASYQRAYSAFLAKDIDGALMILDSVDLEKRLATNTRENQKDSALIKERETSIASRNEQIRQDISQCVFKARLHILKYEFEKAEQMFELALQYAPDDEGLMYEFACFLQKQNKFKTARNYYEKSLAARRVLVEKNPDEHLPGLAATLNSLGILLKANSEMAQAKALYEEALEIRRTLAEKNPGVYLPDVAVTLNNLGILLRANNEMARAKAYHEEALEIRRALAKKNPDAYLQDIAATLNNLGVLLNDNNEDAQAKALFEEALSIKRTLAEKNSDAYLSDLAVTLNNLGVIMKENNEMAQAKAFYKEALETYRGLAQKNPDAYLPYVAGILNNLGNLLTDKREINQAKVLYEEALEIYRNFAEENPDVYLKDVAMILNNLGVLLVENNEIAPAKLLFEQALETYRILAGKNPNVYLKDVAMCLNNLGALSYSNNELNLSKAFFEEALEIRRVLAKKNPDVYLPYVAMSLNNLGGLLMVNNEMAQARANYEEAIDICETLAEKNPGAYNLDVVRTSINLSLSYKTFLEETGDLLLKKSPIALMEDARVRLSIFPAGHPIATEYLGYVNDIHDFFSNFDEEKHQLYQRITLLKAENEAETDFNQRVVRQEKVIDGLLQVARDMPDNFMLEKELAKEYGTLAKHQLFSRQFSAAEASARKGLELDDSEKWISANLALALLFQGKYEEAEALYIQFKDQPFNDSMDYKTAFLRDLEDLEAAGITHPDVEKVRELLKNQPVFDM